MLNRSSLKQALPFLALAGLLGFATLHADDDAKKDKADPVRVKGDREHGDKGPAHDVVMPSCMEKLKLTDKQKQQAKEIGDRYEHSIEAAWAKFKHKYREAIRTEAMFITAVEDNLSGDQLKRIRDERRKTARHHGEAALKNNDAPKFDAKAAKEPDEKARNAEAAKAEVANAEEKASEKAAAREEKRGDSTRPQIDEIDIGMLNLTEEQENAAEEIHDSYHPRLRHISREIERLHTQLISLEADELTELETILTPEQKAELKEARKTAPKPMQVADKNAKNAE